MPRKKKKDPQAITPGEPTTIAAALERSPIAEIIASREAKTHIEPERPMPEPDAHQEAIAAFQRQREREQAVAELPPPQTEVIPSQNRPERPVKSWGETVRGWTNHGETGVRHVTAKLPVGEHGVRDVVGIAFPKDRPRTDEEKREMQDIGLSFEDKVQAWVKTRTPEAFDETKSMSDRFAERRREQAEASIER